MKVNKSPRRWHAGGLEDISLAPPTELSGRKIGQGTWAVKRLKKKPIPTVCGLVLRLGGQKKTGVCCASNALGSLGGGTIASGGVYTQMDPKDWVREKILYWCLMAVRDPRAGGRQGAHCARGARARACARMQPTVMVNRL